MGRLSCPILPFMSHTPSQDPQVIIWGPLLVPYAVLHNNP